MSRLSDQTERKSLHDQPNPRMVSLARDYRGLTQADLAKRLGVQQGTISKIEGQVVGISHEILVKLSQALDFPIQFFMQRDDVYGLGTHAYVYRKRQKITAPVRKRIEAQVNLLRIHADRMLYSLDVRSPQRIPQLAIADSNDSPEQIANAVRAQWLVPSGPIGNVTAMLENAGMVVIPCDFGTTAMDATSIWLPGKNPLIFVNSELPGDRWRFTLCHELGHLVMHSEPTDYMETEADHFAAALLMPDPDILPDLGRVTLQSLARIKPYWKVSIQALVERAYSLRRITKNQRRYFYMNLSKQGYRTREPVPLERETPTLHRRLLEAHSEDLGYTLDDFARLFALFPEQVAELYFSEQPRLRIVK